MLYVLSPVHSAVPIPFSLAQGHKEYALSPLAPLDVLRRIDHLPSVVALQSADLKPSYELQAWS